MRAIPVPFRRGLPFLLALSLFAAQPALAAPTPAQAAINESLAWIDADKLPQALESVKKALQADPKLVEAHLLYIRLMTDMNRRAEVQQEYARLKDTRKDALSLMLYGRTLEKPADMEATFRQALAMDPKLEWAHYCIATIRVQQNKPDQAIASLQEAIRINPRFSQALEALSTLQLSTGKMDDAILTLEKVVALTPDDAQANFQLGSLHGKKGNVARAVPLLEKSHRLAPENPQVSTNLAFMYFKAKRYDESIALYDTVLKKYPDFSEARLNREVVKRVKAGKVKFEAVEAMEKAMEATSTQDAISRYRRVVELDPNFELPYLALGQLLAATKKTDEAEKVFLRAVQLNPGFVEGVRMLAEFYLVMEQPRKAEPALNRALQLAPNEAELYAARGAIYASQVRLPEAEKDFTKAVSLLPPLLSVPTRVNKARVIAAQGRTKDAINELNAALKLAPDFIPAHVELGTCYYQLEQFASARKELSLALKYAPKNKDLQALLKQVDTREAEIKAQAKDHMRARQIVVKTQAEADAILKQLQAGGDFGAIARQKSIGPEAAAGGDVGFFKKGELLPEFEASVVALKPGQLSGVVKTAYGFRIIQRLN